MGLNSLQYVAAKKIHPDTGEELDQRRELTFTIARTPDSSTVGSLYKINSDGAYEIYEPAKDATITLNELQNLQFKPVTNYSTDIGSNAPENKLIFEVSDGVSTPVVEVVEIFVTPINDAPTATFSTAQQATEDETIISGQLTATDVDGDNNLIYKLLGAPIDGLTINPNGTWSFDPAKAAYQSLCR